MCPRADPSGISAPIAAASGSGMRWAGRRAPAASAASRTARCSTPVTPTGTQIITSGLTSEKRPVTRPMKYRSIASVMR